jgi:hypothetical protein
MSRSTLGYAPAIVYDSHGRTIGCLPFRMTVGQRSATSACRHTGGPLWFIGRDRRNPRRGPARSALLSANQAARERDHFGAPLGRCSWQSRNPGTVDPAGRRVRRLIIHGDGARRVRWTIGVGAAIVVGVVMFAGPALPAKGASDASRPALATWQWGPGRHLQPLALLFGTCRSPSGAAWCRPLATARNPWR